jgi:hypothetical protein
MKTTTQHKGELGKKTRRMTDKNRFWLRGRYFNTAWQGKARKHEVGQGKARCQGARKGKVLGRKAREGAREVLSQESTLGCNRAKP